MGLWNLSQYLYKSEYCDTVLCHTGEATRTERSCYFTSWSITINYKTGGCYIEEHPHSDYFNFV
jgi:hypothetical protein